MACPRAPVRHTPMPPSGSRRRSGLGRRLSRRRAGLDAHRRLGRVERCHLRDPSWFQWPLLEAAIEGNIVADFPALQQIVQLLVFGSRPLRRMHARILFESLMRARSPSRARARRCGSRRARRASRSRRARGGSAAAFRSAKSMPARATAASWKSMRSTMHSTISSASACASSPRPATPTCCW